MNGKIRPLMRLAWRVSIFHVQATSVAWFTSKHQATKVACTFLIQWKFCGYVLGIQIVIYFTMASLFADKRKRWRNLWTSQRFMQWKKRAKFCCPMGKNEKIGRRVILRLKWIEKRILKSLFIFQNQITLFQNLLISFEPIKKAIHWLKRNGEHLI